ncbi:MAG TPA: ABC transporter substrate-binding protein, partial [Candidatus Sulfotelmatobacter sp.]|nr:ABC transporter substrate-binding protein [Candidatus Sulfotelmatobacter sp.]
MSLRAYLAVIGVATAISSAANAQNVVIGLSAPITGPAATAAVWERWGVDIALDEINNAGGLLGHKVEIMSLDNHCNPAEAVNVTNKLV